MRNWAIFIAFLASTAAARADVTLLLEEPYGAFGGLTPTGHAAIYLSRVCAATPTSLRRCDPGEQGVVLSRYHRVDGYDWVAVPLIPYLYAVDEAGQVPASTSPEQVALLRDQYRRVHLEGVAPDAVNAKEPRGDWTQLVGEAYDRTIYAYDLETTEDQDDELILLFNSKDNHARFNLLFANCADFAGRVVNFYYPHAIHRDFLADLGIMTPKQVAKCFVHYGKKHPQLDFSSFVIAQIPGAAAPSGQVRGVLDSFIKSKKYAFPLMPLAVLHPAVGIGMAYAWVKGAGFDPRRMPAEQGTPGGLVSDLSASDRLAANGAPSD